MVPQPRAPTQILSIVNQGLRPRSIYRDAVCFFRYLYEM